MTTSVTWTSAQLPAPVPAEGAVRKIGERLISALPSRSHSPRDAIGERLMARLAAEPATRAALFRLVDVAPMCRSRIELSTHLSALLAEADHAPASFRLLERLAGTRGSRGPVGASAALGVRAMAGRFIAGGSVDDAEPELRRLWNSGAAATLDLLGEATVTESEADSYADRCEHALATLTQQTRRLPTGPPDAPDRHGPIPRVDLSIKVSALTPHARAEAPSRGIGSAAARLRAILRRADELGAHLHVDMEALDLRETVTGVVFEVLAEPEFREGPSAGLVLQAYLRDSGQELERWIEWAAASGRRSPLKVRLVKGAYWDQEVVDATQAGWPVPVFESRAECDRNFETLTRRLLGATRLLRPAIGSHNLRSVAHAIAAAEALGLEREIELQVLRGLGDDLGLALLAGGYRVRTYSPVGDLLAGMAYLVRRLLENTSNDSFLRVRASTDDLSQLLAAP